MAALVERHRGLLWLTARETLRVLKLWTQTIAAPVISSFLFILVFGLSLGGRIRQVGGVDFELRLELWAYIRRLHREGTTILLTTHYLEEAEELCEEIALIRGGRLLARDSALGLRRLFEADSLADVYVKAMAS